MHLGRAGGADGWSRGSSAYYVLSYVELRQIFLNRSCADAVAYLSDMLCGSASYCRTKADLRSQCSMQYTVCCMPINRAFVSVMVSAGNAVGVSHW